MTDSARAAPTVNTTDVASPVPERVITPMQSTEVRGNTMTTPSQTGQVRLRMPQPTLANGALSARP